jgi:hypothetical protein
VISDAILYFVTTRSLAIVSSWAVFDDADPPEADEALDERDDDIFDGNISNKKNLENQII